MSKSTPKGLVLGIIKHKGVWANHLSDQTRKRQLVPVNSTPVLSESLGSQTLEIHSLASVQPWLCICFNSLWERRCSKAITGHQTLVSLFLCVQDPTSVPTGSCIPWPSPTSSHSCQCRQTTPHGCTTLTQTPSEHHGQSQSHPKVVSSQAESK
jgi:hypothetical protein